jgi:hypothetical protein
MLGAALPVINGEYWIKIRVATSLLLSVDKPQEFGLQCVPATHTLDAWPA